MYYSVQCTVLELLVQVRRLQKQSSTTSSLALTLTSLLGEDSTLAMTTLISLLGLCLFGLYRLFQIEHEPWYPDPS